MIDDEETDTPSRPAAAGKPRKRKQHKKLLKVMRYVEADFGVHLSPQPTRFVLLSNAGLANGATSAAIMNALPASCRSYAAKHTDGKTSSSPSVACEAKACFPVFPPDKHYSFLRCASVEIAQQVVNALSGNKCLPFLGDQPVYAGFVDRDVSPAQITFGPLPPGLVVLNNRIGFDEELKWLALLQQSQPSETTGPSSLASLKNRQVEHFGFAFDYSINGVRRDQPLHDRPLPALCTAFIEELCQEGILDREHFPNQLTVNRYPPGSGIPAHCDTHSMFTSCIVIVSLVGDTVMEFRRPASATNPVTSGEANIVEGPHSETVSVVIPRGSVLLMADESRYGWTHSIVPRRYDLIPAVSPNEPPVAVARCERVSFTFRRVRSEEAAPCSCQFPSLCDSKSSQQPHAAAAPSTQSKEIAIGDSDARKLEEMHVHQVYDDIANHFSGTRYSQWPRVAKFLRELPRASVVADIGCGNGKNMRIEERADLVFIGVDRSMALLDICHQRNLQVIQSDCLQLPLRVGVFDAAICIAVLHHLANVERRREGLRQLLELVRPGGRVLVYVWAKEQKFTGGHSKYLRQSDACQSEGSFNSDSSAAATTTTTTAVSAPTTADTGSGRMSTNIATIQMGNTEISLPVHRNRSDFSEGADLLVPWKKADRTGSVTKHRFYHVFRKGELKSLVDEVTENGRQLARLVEEYYDEGNWCAVLVRQ